MNTLVSFELAKLLKEKGFNEPVLSYYSKEGELKENLSVINNNSTHYIENEGYFILIPYNGEYKSIYLDKINFNSWGPFDYSAPTIVDVVKWLHEKHGIWIWVERYSTLFRPYAEEIGDEMFGKWEGHKFNSPTEAYEVAILYTLTNLI